MVPLVPTASTLLPFVAPVLVPTRGPVGWPPAEVRWRHPVVPHRHAQQEDRNGFRPDQSPWPVVPGTRIPVVRLVDPVHAVVEEVVRIQLRRVIDRVTRH